MKATKRFLLTLAVMMGMTGVWAQTTDEVVVNPAATANQWTFEMIDADIELEVEYYTDEEIYMEGVELTKVANGLWTLASTPAFNIELEIVYYPAASVTTAPTAVSGLAFTGQDQALVTAGVCEGGEMQYSLDGTAWSTDIPTAINEGTYIVYYKAVGDDTHSDSEPASVEVTIGAALPVDLTSSDGKLWTLAGLPAYDVELQVTYYELPELAWKIDNEDVTGTVVTHYKGFPFTAPALVNEHNLAVSYQSTNTAVATINADGNVTIVALGTTTIKAIFAGDDTYQEDTASYQLTVLAPAVLSLPNNSDWGQVSRTSATYYSGVMTPAPHHDTFYVIPGKEVSLQAQAENSYHVAGWKDENQNDLATASYSEYAITNPTNMFPVHSTLTFTVTGDTTVRAIFAPNSCEVKAYVANNAPYHRGSVTIAYTDIQGQGQTAGPVDTVKVTAQGGSSSTLTATPEQLFHFVDWRNANGNLVGTDNPIEITLLGDALLTATMVGDTFTVTYMNGTEVLKVEKVPYGEAIPEYSPSRPGWRVEWNPALPEVMPAENLTTYAAQWTCDSVQDVDGNKYPAVQIGNTCWMTENLRTTRYADGQPITHVYEYQSTLNPVVPQHYGLLYDWYDAVRASRPAKSSTTYVQGICPQGYHIPTAAEVAFLLNTPANATCSTTGWITPNNNTNSSGFTAYPAGLYNAAPARYEGLGTQTDWWIASGTQNHQSLQIQYYCSTPQIVTRNPDDAVSVRCVLNYEE